MPNEQAPPGPTRPPSTIRGKTFVLVGSSPDGPSQEETARLLAFLGGEWVREVPQTLAYLVVLDRRPNRPTAEERRANALNGSGAAIQVLDWSGFRDLLSP